MRKAWSMWLFPLIVVLWAPGAMARKVAVVPVIYVDAATGKTEPAVARKVEAKVIAGAKEAGYEVVHGALVRKAINVAAGGVGKACDHQCIDRVVRALGVDELIETRVTDEDQISYRVDIYFAHTGNKVSEDRTAGFYVVLEWLQGAVALSLRDLETKGRNATPSAPEKLSEKKPNPIKRTAKKMPRSVKVSSKGSSQPHLGNRVPSAPPTGRHRLSTGPVLVAGLVTGGSAIGFLVLDGATHRQYTTTRDKILIYDPAQSQKTVEGDIDKLERLQLARNIVMGVAIAGVATTLVLALFTDFKKKKVAKPVEKRSVSLMMYADDHGAAVGVGGRF